MSQIKLKHSGGNGVIIAAPASNPASDRTLTCPDLTANATLATVNGITEVDQWYLTTNNSSNGDITSNLSRNAFSGSACPMGTGMSQNNGVFSFPIPGKYLVICKVSLMADGSDNVYIGTKVTLNNGTTYGDAVAYAGDGNNGTGTREGQGTSFYFLDVTDVSQVNKFTIVSITGSSYVKGVLLKLQRDLPLFV